MKTERHITLCVTCSPKFEEVTELDAEQLLHKVHCACCGRSRDGYSYRVRTRKIAEDGRKASAKDKV